ncbi:MAG TPA: zf-HC2 domain-containing protein [Bryobacteraceae bacterium]|jgi:anti-sigma factor RsiW|nr:zf-HC2 domain-containing protein [Bryobacteraceae bacterium]
MSCSNYDWNAYALGELDAAARLQAEAHASACPDCRQELAGTRLTLDALSVLHDVDPPRRIAFVSDKVFEPHWWQRCWEFFRTPSFAGALLIAIAILVHAFAHPAGVDQKQIQTIVARAVADAQQHYQQQLLADYEELQKQNRLEYIKNTGLVRQ